MHYSLTCCDLYLSRVIGILLIGNHLIGPKKNQPLYYYNMASYLLNVIFVQNILITIVDIFQKPQLHQLKKNDVTFLHSLNNTMQ